MANSSKDGASVQPTGGVEAGEVYALRACGFGGPIAMSCPVHGETAILSATVVGLGA